MKTDNQKPVDSAGKKSKGQRYQVRGVVAENAGATIKRLLSYFKYKRWTLIIGLILLGIASLGGVGFGAMIRPIVNSVVYDQDVDKLIMYLYVLAAIVSVQIIANYLGNRLMMRLSQSITHRMRSDLFNRMMKLPIAFFDQNKHGNIMSTFVNDVDMVSQALQQGIPQVLFSVLSFTGSIVVMLILSPLLTLLVIVMLALMIFLAANIGKRSGKNFRSQQAQLANLNGYVEEMMNGQKVVKVFNHEARSIQEFEVHNEELRKSSTQASAFSVVIMPVMGNLSYVMYALIAMLGALLTINGRLDIGTITSFLQYTRSVSQPITQLSNQMNVLLGAIAGAERIFKMLDEPIETNDGLVDLEVTAEGERFWVVPGEAGEVSRVPVQGDIRFFDVDFGYLEGQKVLQNITLWAAPGQKIAFVGSTGAGKTTITNLINRFYEIREGKITFDGIDLKQIKKTALRQTLGMVLQDVHLFEGTVRDNIRYGRLDATNEEVEEAAKLANAHSFICRLPEKYDTMLTSDGQNLSSGERQLLSIARAAVANPLVLILDEATSSVDTRTERHIEKGMDHLMQGRTTFAIAHRLSTVRHSNAILVLESGQIIERGDHDNLLSQRGRYYELSAGTSELS
ncbi:MAG: ABC transporter ATP-binding protein [Clostridia bacterium]|nr:ABC transporter ATP-binding protein [Clostridia bacterium]NLF20302.1 ABC transporter ATP-binding protein [Clostridiaceae bacterium]